MDIVNPTTEKEKLDTTTSSDAHADHSTTCSSVESSATGNSQNLTSKEVEDVDIVQKQGERALQSPSLSINVEQTLNHTDNEPPIIVQLPDLRTAPSLRGRMFVEGNMHKCQGVWAMNDNSHSLSGQTSDFELRLVFPGPAPSEVPVDGRYTGWFIIKHPQKNTTTKIEDRDLDMKFTKKENCSDYDVSGAGVNKFGKFLLQGTLKSNNMIQLYKIYQPKRLGATPRGSVGGSPRPRGTAAALARQSSAGSSSISSPRESSGRVRRPSLALSESLAPAEKAGASSIVNKPPAAQRSSSKQTHKSASVSASPSTASSSRASRPPPFINKCKEVLKDISKQVSAIYFADAVDYVKFGIPDYPTIIKEPMDFGTIRLNLDKQVYKTHEMFSDHMRLVFKNAITYNVRRDNPVHIAARELSDLFEERYRLMVSQLGVNAYTTEVDAPVALSRQPSGTGSRKSSGGKGGRGRGSLSGSQGGGAGPRPMEVPPPPALDGSMQQMMLMHQKMLDMEQELNSLRTAVRQTEIRTSLDQQRVAAQIPLSYDEKKALIENIQRLDGDQITAVVDIIQSAMPSTDCGGEGDEVEIPMDELDTYTLRQLQDYVHSVQQQAISAKRKRQSMSASTTVRNPRGKKAKSSSAPGSAAVPVAHTIPVSSHQQVASSVPVSSGSEVGTKDNALDEEYPVHGRKRSNSLDLFPSLDDMEQDPMVNSAARNVDEKGFEGWTAAATNGDSGTSGSSALNEVGGSWGEAISERKNSLHRESEMKEENEKICEQRAKVENERNNALQRAYEEQAVQSSSHAQNREADLLAQRELERNKRAKMSQTVEFDESHDALYRESFDL